MKSRTVITTFPVPKACRALLSMFKVDVVSWQGPSTRLQQKASEKFHAVDSKTWVTAQIEFKRTLDAVMSELNVSPVPIARSETLPDSVTWNFIGQELAAGWLFPYNFIASSIKAFDNAWIVADFPPPLGQKLMAGTSSYCATLSRLAWIIRRLRITASAIAANALYFWRASRLPAMDKSSDQPDMAKPLVMWLNASSAEFSMSPDGLNISDFVSESTIPFLRNANTVLVEGDAGWRHRHPVQIAPTFLSLARRLEAHTLGSLASLIAFHLRNIREVVFGTWWKVLAARQVSGLNLWRSFYDTVGPDQIVATTSSAHRLPLHIELARVRGSTAHLLFDSTQIRHCVRRQEWQPDVTAGIYMWLNCDRYEVWNRHSATALAALGAAPDRISIHGPNIFSRKAKKSQLGPSEVASVPVIDLYDQQPLSMEGLQFIGAPYLPHGIDYLDRFFEAVAKATEDAFGDTSKVIVRIKTKRLKSGYTHPGYPALLKKYERIFHRLEIRSDGISPLVLHETATMSIGVPFVSPIVSSQANSVPACFFDPDGDVYCGDGQDQGLPVYNQPSDLRDWMIRSADKNIGSNDIVGTAPQRPSRHHP